MPRNRASELALRTRLLLERLLRDDTDRGSINHLAQVCIVSSYVARAGYSALPPEYFEAVEEELAQALKDFDETGVWCKFSRESLASLTDVVNEYDRMLSRVRLELFAKAKDHLDRLIVTDEAAT
jgi:hypothetical protein